MNIELDEIKLVGIKIRTNNKLEMNPATGQIGATVGKYFGQNLASLIENRPSPGKTYSVYTEYASDVNGDYTYFIGEEVSAFENLNPNLTSISIPAQTYSVFTASKVLCRTYVYSYGKRSGKWIVNHLAVKGVI